MFCGLAAKRTENITAHRIALKSGSGSRSPEYVESGDSSSASEIVRTSLMMKMIMWLPRIEPLTMPKQRTPKVSILRIAVHPARRSNRRLKNINTLIDNDKVLDCRWTVYEFLDFIVCSRILYELVMDC
uniref:Uncharacterized protein n=1 Tax=Oryza barthii TaxID=65489 RepID=A0A0D3GHB4_9ORYZ